MPAIKFTPAEQILKKDSLEMPEKSSVFRKPHEDKWGFEKGGSKFEQYSFGLGFADGRSSGQGLSLMYHAHDLFFLTGAVAPLDDFLSLGMQLEFNLNQFRNERFFIYLGGLSYKTEADPFCYLALGVGYTWMLWNCVGLTLEVGAGSEVTNSDYNQNYEKTIITMSSSPNEPLVAEFNFLVHYYLF